MKLSTVLFDLDGTLLPMDQEVFVKAYLGLLSKRMAPHGYDPREIVDAVWKGTDAMVRNDGSRTNEAVFWNLFQARFGPKSLEDMPIFEDFYRTDFELARGSCGFTPEAARTLELCRELGLRTTLATNPIFPDVADASRLSWIGLKMEDFDLVTDMSNCCYCKPNPAYYKAILEQFGLEPEHCLMVGNNAKEDWQAASAAGIPCYLLTDNIINPDNIELTCPHGSYADMVDYLRSL